MQLNKKNLVANQVNISFTSIENEEVVKVAFDTLFKDTDIASFAKIKNINFKDGSIEVKVLSQLHEDAPVWARGFIGLAFRIKDDNSKFESIYIRPVNGRSENQIQRNHSIQYFAFPDFRFDYLRKSDPEKYESFADMGLNEWITIRIEVDGVKARFFVNDSTYPSLVVNDLKWGNNNSGSIGLWVGNWTEGYFKDLKVIKK
ncbi:hypothetical protein TK44_04105 [Jiulongibacter sediminis]|nr:hypothetical protein TK44_04105 [Jiulongibacter sediminis]